MEEESLNEYYNGMKAEISESPDSKLRDEVRKRLEELKSEIQADGEMNWGWAVNYLL